MFRFVLGSVLVCVGVFAPWLVRDWLDWSADQNAADRVYEVVTSLPEKVIGERDLLASNEESMVEDQTGLSRREYPIASKTMRLLQGFLPDSFSTTSGKKIPMMGMPSSPMTSPHSRSVVSATSRDLRSSLSRIGLELGDPIFLRLFKEENELEVWMKPDGQPDYALFKVYRIEDRAGRPGPKLREGDGQAPEGFYFVSGSRMIPDTRHHLAMDLGFPNDYDKYHGRTGSDMLIHGGSTHAGSFALAPNDMSEIYTLAQEAIEGGQKFFRVNVFPFRMSDRRMAAEWQRQSKWMSFWKNLKEGYDFFENVNYPPDVSVEKGDYAFSLH